MKSPAPVLEKKIKVFLWKYKITYDNCKTWGLHGYLVYVYKEENEYAVVEF